MDSATALVPTSLALRRGLVNRCPCCGRGRILHKYITPLSSCESCGLDYARLRADDGPAWLTILVVGHLMVPFIYAVIESDIQSSAAILGILIPLALLFCVLILPRAKGVFMAIIWATRVRENKIL